MDFFFISLCFSEEFDSFVISMNYFYIRIAKESILFWGKMSTKKRSISRKKWWISYSTGILLSLCLTQILRVEKAFWPCSWPKGRMKRGAHRKITWRWDRRRQSHQNSCPGNRPLLVTPLWSWELCSHHPLLRPLPPVRKQTNGLLQKLPPFPDFCCSPECICSLLLGTGRQHKCLLNALSSTRGGAHCGVIPTDGNCLWEART